jgi:uncharacterized protein YaiL (DUF2058 family)
MDGPALGGDQRSMTDSLKEQLIALGLAKEKAKPARNQGRRKPGPRPGTAAGKKPGPDRDREIALEEAWRRKQQSEHQAAEESRRRKQAEDEKRRRINKEIQAIVEANKLNDPKAELKRNFQYKGRIRSVLVNAEQLKLLNSGLLALVFLKGSYFLVTPEVAKQVRMISADHVPDLGGAEPEADGEHPVPDDLIW